MFTNFYLGHCKEKTHVFGKAKTITVQHMDTFVSKMWIKCENQNPF